MKELITDETIKGLAQMAENLLLSNKEALNVALAESYKARKPLSVGVRFKLAPVAEGVEVLVKLGFAGPKVEDEASDTLTA